MANNLNETPDANRVHIAFFGKGMQENQAL